MKGYFITGTDTSVGKTVVAGRILQQLGSKGYKTLGLKPIASGCVKTSRGLQSTDALYLMKQSTIPLPYECINPYAFELPIAPHIAALWSSETLTISKIICRCQTALTSSIDWIIIEGAGGWRVPLNNQETMADLAKAFGFPVILVVKIQLGCINHALLTYESILNNKVSIKGWVANVCLPEADKEITAENISIIKQYLDIPFLGKIPYNGQDTWRFLHE